MHSINDLNTGAMSLAGSGYGDGGGGGAGGGGVGDVDGSSPYAVGYAAASAGVAGPGRGRYGRSKNIRSPLRPLTDTTNNPTGRHSRRRPTAQWAPPTPGKFDQARSRTCCFLAPKVYVNLRDAISGCSFLAEATGLGHISIRCFPLPHPHTLSGCPCVCFKNQEKKNINSGRGISSGAGITFAIQRAGSAFQTGANAALFLQSQYPPSRPRRASYPARLQTPKSLLRLSARRTLAS